MKAHQIQSLRKTTTTTTEDPTIDYYGSSYDDSYYSFGDYGYSMRIDYEYWWSLILKIHKTHDISIPICFLINFFHILVLSRKHLRHDFVYLVLKAIAIFNLYFNLSELIPIVFESKIVYKIEEDCVGGRPLFHQRIVVWCHMISVISRKYGSLLGLFLAGFRIFSLAQPMNRMVRVIRRSSLKVFMFCIVPTILWYMPYFLKFKIERSIGCDYSYTPATYKRFSIEMDPRFERFYSAADGYMSMVLGAVFWVLAMVLCLQLQRNGINIDKVVSKHKRNRSDNTTLLIIAITTLFVLSTGSSSTFFIITKFVLKVSKHPILEYYSYHFSDLVTTLAIAFCGSQLLACLLISSKYRRAARSLIWKQEKTDIYFVRPSTTSSVSSRKTRPYLGLY